MDQTIVLKLTQHQVALLRSTLWDRMEYCQERQMCADEDWIEDGWANRARDTAVLANIVEAACGLPIVPCFDDSPGDFSDAH